MHCAHLGPLRTAMNAKLANRSAAGHLMRAASLLLLFLCSALLVASLSACGGAPTCQNIAAKVGPFSSPMDKQWTSYGRAMDEQYICGPSAVRRRAHLRHTSRPSAGCVPVQCGGLCAARAATHSPPAATQRAPSSQLSALSWPKWARNSSVGQRGAHAPEVIGRRCARPPQNSLQLGGGPKLRAQS